MFLWKESKKFSHCLTALYYESLGSKWLLPSGVVYETKKHISHLPGQPCVLQATVLDVDPAQPRPPCAGLGFVQVRY